MRVTPRVWIGLTIYVGYVLVIYVVSRLSGVAYTDIGKSAEFTWRGAVLDLAVGAVLLAITTWLLGWWKPALFERKRSHHRWPIFVPAIMLVVAILNLSNTDWSKFDASFILSLLALGIAVGFCEELLSRGLLLTAFRSQLSEVWVWLLTSLLFGAMHLINAALGAPLASTLGQVLIAAMSGTCFYIVRRVTGSLIWAMALHGIWDVSAFSVGFAPLGPAWATFLTPVIGLLAVAVVYWVIKGTDEKPIALTTATTSVRR
ncbi:CPBP family intramembrane glutamic endopeptidase [Microbacterium sp. B35-30]|uniref:CPBP family intramembrane glutamic endopeptidase n=1 Tax=Microbacterium sp. B35-30 TaxID=1962642 RepID=UPI001EF8EEC8|nr:CPBP family intramembrane glutamic endopeptidase [Microbacterium sp. B35-30]